MDKRGRRVQKPFMAAETIIASCVAAVVLLLFHQLPFHLLSLAMMGVAVLSTAAVIVALGVCLVRWLFS